MEEIQIIDRKQAKEIGLVYKDFVIKVSSDDLYVYLEPPYVIEEFKEFWPEIRKFLESQGIKFVLDEPVFREGKLILAKGHLPKEGIPERFELFPKFAKILEDRASDTENYERKDLREEFQKIICAEKDEPIAKWFPAVPPVPGINIWGDPLEPPPLKEKKTLELGTEVYLDEKDNQIKAKSSGVVKLEKNKIEVFPEFTLEGDVDFSIGNIHFIGKKLTIKGDIKFGFKVITKGDLELKGCTENKVFLKVDGNLISDGIIRGEETQVYVKGEARLRGVEFANLVVEGNLYVTDYLIFSQVQVLGDIIAIKGKGVIYGGDIRARGNIEAKILGHLAQTKTTIMAGYTSDIVERYLNLLDQEHNLTQLLKKVRSGIQIAEKIKKERRLSPKQEEILEKLLIEQSKIEEKLKKIQKELRDIKDQIKDLRGKSIKVYQKIYPNVILSIADITYTVDIEKSGPIKFILEGEQIKFIDGN